jgi:hypothetical protein
VRHRISDGIHHQIFEMALEETDLSPRELAARFTRRDALLRVRSQGLRSFEDR